MTPSRANEIARHHFGPLADLTPDTVEAIKAEWQRSFEGFRNDPKLGEWKGCCDDLSKYCLHGTLTLTNNIAAAAQALQRFSGWYHAVVPFHKKYRPSAEAIHDLIYVNKQLPYLKIGEEWECGMERLSLDLIQDGRISIWNFAKGKTSETRTEEKLRVETTTLASRLLNFAAREGFQPCFVEQTNYDEYIQTFPGGDVEALPTDNRARRRHPLLNWSTTSTFVEITTKIVEVEPNEFTSFLSDKGFNPNTTKDPRANIRHDWFHTWTVLPPTSGSGTHGASEPATPLPDWKAQRSTSGSGIRGASGTPTPLRISPLIKAVHGERGMATLDFQEFGRDDCVDVPVDFVNHRLGNLPVFVLLSEKHDANCTIVDNVQTTINLIDKKVISRVFVEDYFEDDVRAQVEREVKKLYGGISLEERSEQILSDYTSEDELFAALKDADFKVSFARWILFLRPHTAVTCVEQPALKLEADQVNEAIGRESAQEADSEAERLRKIVKFRGHPVNRCREQAFVENALQSCPADDFAVVLNAGGYHNPYVIDILESKGIGHILTQSPSYTDEVNG